MMSAQKSGKSHYDEMMDCKRGYNRAGRVFKKIGDYKQDPSGKSVVYFLSDLHHENKGVSTTAMDVSIGAGVALYQAEEFLGKLAANGVLKGPGKGITYRVTEDVGDKFMTFVGIYRKLEELERSGTKIEFNPDDMDDTLIRIVKTA